MSDTKIVVGVYITRLRSPDAATLCSCDECKPTPHTYTPGICTPDGGCRSFCGPKGEVGVERVRWQIGPVGSRVGGHAILTRDEVRILGEALIHEAAKV